MFLLFLSIVYFLLILFQCLLPLCRLILHLYFSFNRFILLFCIHYFVFGWLYCWICLYIMRSGSIYAGIIGFSFGKVSLWMSSGILENLFFFDLLGWFFFRLSLVVLFFLVLVVHYRGYVAYYITLFIRCGTFCCLGTFLNLWIFAVNLAVFKFILRHFSLI